MKCTKAEQNLLGGLRKVLQHPLTMESTMVSSANVLESTCLMMREAFIQVAEQFSYPAPISRTSIYTLAQITNHGSSRASLYMLCLLHSAGILAGVKWSFEVAMHCHECPQVSNQALGHGKATQAGQKPDLHLG